MTRDEAIINLKLSQNRIGGIKKEEWVALQMAIEALTYQNPSKPNNTCDVDRISRADAIDAVRKCVVESELLADWNKAMESAQELLSELPSADAEWIPCSERLPKAEDMYQPPEQRYLCQLEAHGMRKFCVLSRLKGAAPPFWDWYGIAVYDSEVIAWMPLPKPYREDGE